MPGQYNEQNLQDKFANKFGWGKTIFDLTVNPIKAAEYQFTGFPWSALETRQLIRGNLRFRPLAMDAMLFGIPGKYTQKLINKMPISNGAKKAANWVTNGFFYDARKETEKALYGFLENIGLKDLRDPVTDKFIIPKGLTEAEWKKVTDDTYGYFLKHSGMRHNKFAGVESGIEAMANKAKLAAGSVPITAAQKKIAYEMLVKATKWARFANAMGPLGVLLTVKDLTHLVIKGGAAIYEGAQKAAQFINNQREMMETLELNRPLSVGYRSSAAQNERKRAIMALNSIPQLGHDFLGNEAGGALYGAYTSNAY
jgi:hypothetical protein